MKRPALLAAALLLPFTAPIAVALLFLAALSPSLSTAATATSASPTCAAAVDLASATDNCADASTSGWVAPANGPISDTFRPPDRPGHAGIDIAAGRYALIRAASAGVVTVAACDVSIGTCDEDGSLAVSGCGWHVTIDHGDGVSTRYCHMVSRPLVTAGEHVQTGQVIGYVGASGNVTGPHLHFETRIDSIAVDPIVFLRERGVRVG